MLLLSEMHLSFSNCDESQIFYFSQAVKVGPTLYLSGSIGIDPATNEFAGNDVETQTRQVSYIYDIYTYYIYIEIVQNMHAYLDILYIQYRVYRPCTLDILFVVTCIVFV